MWKLKDSTSLKFFTRSERELPQRLPCSRIYCRGLCESVLGWKRFPRTGILEKWLFAISTNGQSWILEIRVVLVSCAADRRTKEPLKYALTITNVFNFWITAIGNNGVYAQGMILFRISYFSLTTVVLTHMLVYSDTSLFACPTTLDAGLFRRPQQLQLFHCVTSKLEYRSMEQWND